MAKQEIKSTVTGTVWKILLAAGDQVAAGDEIMILESMKMEIPVEATADGTIAEILVAEEEPVEEGAAVAVVDTAS